MEKCILLIIIATTAAFSCNQSSKASTETADTETVNSARKYEYSDSTGKGLTIYNSPPKGGGYIDSNGNRHPHVIFYTQITNETDNPVELKIDFPKDSFEFPHSTAVYMKLFIPYDTMTPEKVDLTDYGLSTKTYLDTGTVKSHSLKRVIHSNETTAFYVVMVSNKGMEGSLRTGFYLKGQNLFYKISAYKSVPGHPLMDEKEIDCGSISLRNLTAQK